jgi:hypothetical protein
MKQFYVFILLLISLCSCHKNDSDYLNEWRNDKNACKGTRTVEKTEKLITALKLKELNYTEISKILGVPDRYEETNNAKYSQYLIENNCSISEKDICMLSIIFFKNKSETSVSITCT